MPVHISSSTPDCEIVSSKTFNAPKELVFRAWAEPDHLKNWWGPAGFTNTFNEFDFRAGGKWNFIMHGPDKGNYRNECEFITIEEPLLITWKRYTQPLFQVVVTFEEVAPDKTTVIFKQLFDTAETCSKIRLIAVDKNEEMLNRLENELIKMSPEVKGNH